MLIILPKFNKKGIILIVNLTYYSFIKKIIFNYTKIYLYYSFIIKVKVTKYNRLSLDIIYNKNLGI